ncbi:MAG: PfkB family carbohydrate kinase [Actinomycetota bacterium]|nr:PfkB family carbohydrate kinase [Actinomycetota bacterium]
MRTAVVGHVEWVEFIRVPRNPAVGEIVHATEWWEEPGGGGPDAAAQLFKLSGDCTLFTALGDDELGRRAEQQLTAMGLRLHIAWRPEPTRRAVTHIDAEGERTITVLGDRLAPTAADPLPWDELEHIDGVYFTAGDTGAVELARRSRVVVVSARALPVVREAGVLLDVIVGSALDPDEAYEEGDLDPAPRMVVQTRGADGATCRTKDGSVERVPAPDLPGPLVDRYGAGDSFAAGLTYALALGKPPREAVELAARCGAATITGRGPFEGQLLASDLHRRP